MFHQNDDNGHAPHKKEMLVRPFTNEAFGKVEQKMKCGFSKHFSMVRVGIVARMGYSHP